MGWGRSAKLIVCAVVFLLLVFGNGVGQVHGLSSTGWVGSDPPMAGLPAPSQPLSYPPNPAGGSDSVTLSSAMFQGLCPPIPNLQLGYIFYFGPKVRSGRGIADFVLPLSIGNQSVFFGEVHGEFQSFWRTLSRGERHRIDLAFGGGFRTVLRHNTFLGVNAFYDTTSFGSYGRWYSSGGAGFEMASLLPGGGEMNVEFNYYGDIFSRTGIANWFRHGPRNFDVQAAYSTPLYYGGPRVELRGTGYRFDLGDRSVYGGKFRTLLASRDNVFQLRYEVGHDQIDSTYHSIGGYVNIPLQFDNLFRGASPFAASEPAYTACAYKPCAEECDKRFARYLSRPVNRNYFQPASVIVVRDGGNGGNGGNGGDGEIPRLAGRCLPVSPWFPPPGPPPTFTNCCFEEVDINDLDPALYVTVHVTGVLNSQGISDNQWMLHIYIASNVAGQCAPGGPADRVEIASVLITNPDALMFLPLDITVSSLQSALVGNPEGVSLSLQAINSQASDVIPAGWSAEVTFNVATP